MQPSHLHTLLTPYQSFQVHDFFHTLSSGECSASITASAGVPSTAHASSTSLHASFMLSLGYAAMYRPRVMAWDCKWRGGGKG